jgi:hypothetical protein
MAVLECHSEAKPKKLLFPELKSRCFAGAQHDIMRTVRRRFHLLRGVREHEALRGILMNINMTNIYRFSEY